MSSWKTLKSLGLRIVVFSNATFRSSAGYLRDFRSFSANGLIDDVISSVDIGFRKPSDQMFAAALRAARRRPSESVVVGDSEQNDIVPAFPEPCALSVSQLRNRGLRKLPRMRSQPHCMKPLRSSRAGGAAWTKARSRFVRTSNADAARAVMSFQISLGKGPWSIGLMENALSLAGGLLALNY